MAVASINAVPDIARVLVICPAKLKILWAREMRFWLTKKLTIGIVEPDCFPSTDIVIINFDVLHKFPRRLEFFWDLIIIDECHFLKSPKSRRTKCVFGYRPKRDEPAELAKSGIPAKRRLALSGTPICNRREEIWPIVSYLNPEKFDQKFWWKFCRKMTDAQAQTYLRSHVMIRRLKSEVLKELPPKRRQIVPLPPDTDTQQFLLREKQAVSEYDDRLAELEAAVELAKAKDEDTYRAAVKSLRQGVSASFEEISRIRHETALAKLPLAKQYIEEMLEEIPKLIILAYHRDVIDELHRSFQGVGALKIYGGMNGTESQRAVDLFQNDPNYKIIILQIHIAVGMTLTAASNVVAVELDWVPGNMSQAEDRCHRISQHDSVNVYHLVLEGSLDQNMAETLVEKQTMIDATLDDMAKQEAGQEPVTMHTARKVRFTRQNIQRDAATITPETAGHIHAALKLIASQCNGAKTLDAAGFSKIDTRIGHDLAGQFFLTPGQAAIGKRLCEKYRKQLPSAALERCGIHAPTP